MVRANQARIGPTSAFIQIPARKTRDVAEPDRHRDPDLAARLLRAMGPRVEEADFAGDGIRQAVEWAVDAAPGQAP